MEPVRSLLPKRSRTLSQDCTGKVNADSNNESNGSLDSNNQERSAAERVFSIPEIVLIMSKQASPWTRLTLCLLSKTCSEIVPPLIWKRVSCNTIDTFKKIKPHIGQRVHCIEALNIDMLPAPFVSSLLQEISPFQVLPNLTSLSIRDTGISLDQLSTLLAKVPQLKDIALERCALPKNPLEVLAQCKNIESMTFGYGNVLLPGGFDLSTAFSPWTRLRRLSILWPDSRTAATNRQFDEILNRSQLDLESLEWSIPCWQTDIIAGIITRSPNLKRLALNNCDLSESRWIQVLPSLANLQSITFHNAVGGIQPFSNRYRVFQACPLIQHVDLKGFNILHQHFKVLAKTATALTSLTLGECQFPPDGLRQILDQCNGLERLQVHKLTGAGSLKKLFEKGSWACTKLQELRFHNIVWTTNHGEATTKEYLDTMWKSLSKLSRLRVLTLRHVHRSDSLGLAIHWFGAPSSLENLHLAGHGSWMEEDLEWIAEHLPRLEKLMILRKEMDTVLQSWLYMNRPGERNTNSNNEDTGRDDSNNGDQSVATHMEDNLQDDAPDICRHADCVKTLKIDSALEPWASDFVRTSKYQFHISEYHLTILQRSLTLSKCNLPPDGLRQILDQCAVLNVCKFRAE
ncbi:MAG: hypothetical protein J3Q66DRAFT_374627 [Benniella sp.]|nr:MAG: hypothetical protein J3Q66DRAFT_374627 [Benniella sp.]